MRTPKDDREDLFVFVPADVGSGRPLRDDEPIVLAWAHADRRARAQTAPNTVIVGWDDLIIARLDARTVDGSQTASMHEYGAALMDGLQASPQVTSLADQVSASPPGGDHLVPLLHLRRCQTPQPATVYRMVERGPADCCYLRIGTTPTWPTTTDTASWLRDILAQHERVGQRLNNHLAYFQKCLPGHELEYKFTLPPPAPIYSLAARAVSMLGGNNLPGFRLSYRDEFQTWDYLNHMFRIDAPADAIGYVSFIPAAVGGRIKQKRKWFTADALARREEISDLGRLDLPLEQYVRDELGLTATRLPTFRRIRYDVNLESITTGNIFGIFYDRCTLAADPTIAMSQCEVEYVKSRTAHEPDTNAMLSELDTVAVWTQQTLQDAGIDAERSFYSKLSFLVDTVRRHPELIAAMHA